MPFITAEALRRAYPVSRRIVAPSSLPTLAEMRATRRATPKYSKAERADANKAANRDDELKLEAWRKEVRKLDEWTDRFTGKRVEKTIELLPDRAECHHHEPRENYDVRYDIRNGILLSLKSHARIKAGTLKIVPTKGSKFYRVAGKKYLNMRGPVRFVEVPL